MLRILFFLISLHNLSPTPTLAVKSPKVELNHSDVVRSLKSKYKVHKRGKKTYRGKKINMDGAFADRFLKHPDSAKRKVTFKKTPGSANLIYEDTEVYYTTPAQDQIVIEGLVTLELVEVK